VVAVEDIQLLALVPVDQVVQVEEELEIKEHLQMHPDLQDKQILVVAEDQPMLVDQE
jgi:hypoxanthine phosphoribosyltransferase